MLLHFLPCFHTDNALVETTSAPAANPETPTEMINIDEAGGGGEVVVAKKEEAEVGGSSNERNEGGEEMKAAGEGDKLDRVGAKGQIIQQVGMHHKGRTSQ